MLVYTATGCYPVPKLTASHFIPLHPPAFTLIAKLASYSSLFIFLRKKNTQYSHLLSQTPCATSRIFICLLVICLYRFVETVSPFSNKQFLILGSLIGVIRKRRGGNVNENKIIIFRW
jgi:hypothetical protein